MGQENSCRQTMNIAATPFMESEDQGFFFLQIFWCNIISKENLALIKNSMLTNPFKLVS
jgi:hypothetical protein